MEKIVPIKAIHYLTLVLKLNRLYASIRSAPHMISYCEFRRLSSVLSHPSDGEALTHSDNDYLNIASEPRYVRLGLCADGFTPLSNTTSPYSC